MANLHRLTEQDAKYTDNKGHLSKFNGDTENHQLSILHDDGLYRHLRFKAPDSGFYWFDLITWPGNLTITGDMGTYTFRRVEDMFTFFTGYINTSYWAEKLQNGSVGGRHAVRAHNEDLFKKWLVQDFWEASREMTTRETKDWWMELQSEFLGAYPSVNTEDAGIVIEALLRLNPSDAVSRHYSEVWEAAGSWQQYDMHFEYCLAAIVTGIRTYNAHTAAAVHPAGGEHHG